MQTRRTFIQTGLAVAALAAASPVAAMFAGMTIPERVAKSETVVIGRLASIRETDDPNVALGTIEVRETLKGDKTETVILRLPGPGKPISSSDVIHKTGAEGLWFLRRVEGSASVVYAADHPQRFVPMTEVAEILDEVRRAIG